MAHLLYFERTVNFILLKKRLEQYLHLYCYCIPLLNGDGQLSLFAGLGRQ